MLTFLTAIFILGLVLWIEKFVVTLALRTYFYVIGLFVIGLTALEKISDRLTGLGFNDAVVYHIMYGLGGAGYDQFIPLIIVGTFGSLLILVVWSYIIFFRRSSNSRPSRFNKIGTATFATLTVLFHPTLHSTFRLIYPTQSEMPMVTFYVKPSLQAVPQKLPNIVWIYAESVERGYLDEKVFPALMPHFKALESESLSFTDVDQIGSSGWTIAGIVASQCGVPLVVTGGSGNSMQSMPHFLPGATCIGDLLKTSGYSLTFMGGADSVFAGKGKFFRNHGFQNVLGLAELPSRLSDKSYLNNWGLYDDSLTKLAFAEFESLLNKKQPFGLFVLTLDTHHPSGYTSASCSEIPYGDGKNPMLNAVHCSDRLIANLAREIAAKDPNTLIVISSDHLAMKNDAYDQLLTTDRENLLIYYWPSRIKPSKNPRKGSTFSSGVTALDLMGFKSTGLGLGRSLLGGAPTIREAIPNAQETVVGWDYEFRKLWNVPENPKSLHVDPLRKFVSFSGAIYKMPLIVDISESEKFPRLYYGNDDASLSTIINQLGPESRSIWFDTCELIINALKKSRTGSPLEICIWDDKLKEITKVNSSMEYLLN